MKSMVIVVIAIALILVLGGVSYAWFGFKKDTALSPSTVPDTVMEKICMTMPNSTFTQYVDTSGRVGGYAQGTALDRGAFWGFLWDPKGEFVDLNIVTESETYIRPADAYISASAPVREALTKAAGEYMTSLKKNYPVEKTFTCG